MIATLRWDPGWRLTRRWAPGRGNALDLRRVVRRNIRYGGEPLVLPTRGRTVKRRPLVLICDVSGSMERYARMLLHFMHSLAGGLDRVEAFLFAARLTRITRELVLRRERRRRAGHSETRARLGRRHQDRGRPADVQRPMGEPRARARGGRAADFRWLGSRRAGSPAPGNGTAAAELSSSHLAEPAARIGRVSASDARHAGRAPFRGRLPAGAQPREPRSPRGALESAAGAPAGAAAPGYRPGNRT